MAANMDTAAHLRYMATIRRQSAPPRCHPFVIVLQVLALGMIFIGVTMTLIAHWPGSTSIGENPLKVAGPVLLSVGVVALIIGIVLVGVVNTRERRRWQKQMARMIISRSNADLVGMDDESQQREHVTTYPPDAGHRDTAGAVEQGRIGVRDSAGVRDNMVTDGDTVPMPVRVTKPRRQKDTSTDGDLSMSSTEDLTAPSDGDQAAPRNKRRRPRQPAEVPAGHEEGEALMSGDSAAVQPSPGEARRLKVHIKAQPGSSVRIQNAPPPVAPKPAYRAKPHDTSTETDI